MPDVGQDGGRLSVDSLSWTPETARVVELDDLGRRWPEEADHHGNGDKACEIEPFRARLVPRGAGEVLSRGAWRRRFHMECDPVNGTKGMIAPP